MLSIAKLILFVLIVAGAYQVFQVITRFGAPGKPGTMGGGKRERVGGGGQGSSASPVAEAEDMVKCRLCGAYVSGIAARNCGRPDCPYPKP